MQAELQVVIVVSDGTINISGCHSTGNIGGGGGYNEVDNMQAELQVVVVVVMAGQLI